ncbi:RHS repeat-associated core domain-containing protein, partial [Mesorhizobium sp. IMUNJ 23232]|uniref:RHS repeat-associated core domain-containing protein n=1 Tax=Mesorhizobium sp. IMUNJ 23232 TaxID=3376064 RepID=UPI0037B61FC5
MAQGFVQVLINLDQYKELLRPPGVTDLDWTNVWNQFKARFHFDNLSGPPFLSIYSLLEAVAPESNELYLIGQGTRDLGELLQFALLQSTGVLPKTVLASSVDLNLSGGPIDLFLARTYDGSMLARNKAGMFGDGWSSNFDISAVTDTKGNVVIAAPGALRSFTLNADGTFSANNGAFGSLALVAGAYVLTETDGSTAQFRADGRLAAMTDANGNTVTANWSVANQLIGVSSSTGQSLIFTYNGQGRVATATDSEGQVTTYTYDASGAHLLSVTTAAGTTAYAYKAAPGTPSDSALISITYQDGTHHFFEYGTNGRLTAEFDDGNADKVTYNHGTPGKVVVTDALGHETTLFYDSDGNIARVLDANAHATNLSYDDFGNLTKVVTPGGSVASYAYDSFGHVTSFIDPLGGTISSSYDVLGHIASLTDQRGNTMTYGHDAKGNLTSIGYADSTQTTFIATATGQLHSVTNARSQTATFTYDAGGHVIAKNFSDGTNESYTYDSHGNLTSATARNGGATNYTYDAADRLTSVTDAIGRTESFTYDAAGRRVERVDPDGTVTKYSYDAAGRLSELRDGVDGLLVKYSYDAAGQLSRIDNGNGTHTSYTHDAVGNVTAIKNFSAVNAVISQEVYNYTIDSQVSTKSTLDGTWTYAYDKAGQLTHAVFTSTNASVANQDIAYAYDAAGNRISTTVDGVVTNYTANALNQYTSATGVSYNYDADGNLKTKTDSSGSWTYTYDIENQLTAVVGPGGQTWSYSYDALGNRIASTHNGITETYVIDPFGLGNVAQTYTSGGTLSTTYSYGYGLAAAIGAGSTSYYTTDLTGNVTGLTNGSGNLTDSYFYDPFGDVTHVTGTSTNPFQFNGAHGVSTDSSELSFMRSRYYDNTDGRFIERDPINLNGGTNLYEYVANNPISFVDPSGLSYVNIGVTAGDGPAVGVGFIVDDYGNTYLQLGGGAGYGAGASATYGPGAVQQGFGVSVQGGIGEGFDGGFGIDENGRPTGGEAGPSVGAGFVVLLTYTWKLPWNINPFGNPGPSPDFSWSDNDGFPGGGGTQHGSPGDGSGTSVSMYCCVSVDESGRWVAYESPDSAITTDDTNGKNDIFLYQTADIVLPAGSIQRILTPTGEQGNGDSFNPVLSGDGWWVSFTTLASNFAADDTNGASDVFLTGFDRLTQRISVSTAGLGGDAASYLSSVSYDASQVAFVSEATNLVAGDTNGFADIFLRDINLATTELISKGAGSAKANGDSTMPAISASGNLVAFVSSASNLVAGDTNGERDIFVRDRVAESTTLVTKGLGGSQANGDSWAPAITPDGRYIAYFSYASNLVAGDANGKADVFITDRVTGVTERVSVGLSNVEANGDSGGKPVTGPFPGNAWGVDVSSDGRYVSFISEASNLVAGDANGKADVFLYDRLAHIMTLVSKSDSGALASGGALGSLYAGAVAISGDASVIAYISDATNILASDTNASADIFVHKSNDPISAKAGTLSVDTMVGSDTRDAFAGFDSDDVLNGVAGDDLLYGGNGNDRLTGGLGADFMDGGSGSDRMFGGAGDDTYLVDDVSDTVVELVQSGQDRAQTLLNGYILAANVEELALLGSADLNTTGNSGNNLIFGNSGANVINGGAGNDVITAGTGGDSLAGGSGNDRALGEAGDDIEHGGIGDDILNGGDGNDQLFGEAGDDLLSGDSGDDVLDGGDGTDTLDGGVGKDTMRGGAGGDTYVVDDAGDVVIEASAGAGEIDAVKSTISYTLTKYVENLVLMGTALNGTGNSSSNNITGNDLANTLDGQGGFD